MLQVVQHPVHLVHIPLGIVVLHPQLIAIGFADGAALIRPLVPDMAPQVTDVVGLLLPDPQQFVHRRLPVGPADGKNGKFLPQVIAVDDAEFFDRMGRRSVLPVRAHLLLRIPDAVLQNIPAVLNEYLVRTAHTTAPLQNFSKILHRYSV